jgi:hypothetical protein
VTAVVRPRWFPIGAALATAAVVSLFAIVAMREAGPREVGAGIIGVAFACLLATAIRQGARRSLEPSTIWLAAAIEIGLALTIAAICAQW